VAVDVSISVVDFTDVVAGVVVVIRIVVELLVDGANVVVGDNDVVDFVFSVVRWVVFNWVVVPILGAVLASDVRVGELVSVESVEDSVDVCSIVFVFMSVDECWMVVPMLEVSVEDSVDVCSIVFVVMSVGFVVASPVVIVVSAVDGSVVGMVVVESECCVVARAEVVFCWVVVSVVVVTLSGAVVEPARDVLVVLEKRTKMVVVGRKTRTKQKKLRPAKMTLFRRIFTFQLDSHHL